jgi:hypothetical protein
MLLHDIDNIWPREMRRNSLRACAGSGMELWAILLTSTSVSRALTVPRSDRNRTGMHSGRRIQQHLDSNSGFQSDVIMGDNIEFAIPDCYFATTRRPLFRQTQPRLDPSNRVLGRPKIGLRKSPAVRSPEIRSAQRPRLPLPNLRMDDDDRGLRRPRPHTRNWCGVA